jgi:hypothetical protein
LAAKKAWVIWRHWQTPSTPLPRMIHTTRRQPLIGLMQTPPKQVRSTSENEAYQTLATDINKPNADKRTIHGDIQQVVAAAIESGDFGLGQAAIDVGMSENDGTFNASTSLQHLKDAAPGTQGALLPPLDEDVTGA